MKHVPGTQLTLKEPIPNIDFGAIPPEIEKDRRAVAEEETRRDLTKSYEQLLADSHHEITDPNPNRGPMVNLGFSNRRIAGITARAAMAMDEAARESSKATAENLKLQTEVRDLTADLKTLTVTLKRLTIGALIFALLACLFAAGQLYYAQASLSVSKQQLQLQLSPPKPKTP